MKERLNQRLELDDKHGLLWVWEEKRGNSLVTMVQTALIKICPECHYPYCLTIPVQAWAVSLIHCLGRYQCPECGWTEGLPEGKVSVVKSEQ